MILYTRYQCAACNGVKQQLQVKGLEYTEANIEDDFDAAMSLINDGIRSVPVLELDDGTRFVGGASIAAQL